MPVPGSGKRGERKGNPPSINETVTQTAGQGQFTEIYKRPEEQ